MAMLNNQRVFQKMNPQIIDFGVGAKITSNFCLRFHVFPRNSGPGAYRSERRCTGPQENIRILEGTFVFLALPWQPMYINLW